MLGESHRSKIGKHCQPQGIFGVALARKRILAGLSQTELGIIFGVHRVTITRWETGVFSPSPKRPVRRNAMWILGKLASASDFERRKLLIEMGII